MIKKYLIHFQKQIGKFGFSKLLRAILTLTSITLLIITCIGYAQPANSPWPMYQHDPQHTGRSEYTGPRTPAVRWVCDIRSDLPILCRSQGPIVGANGMIYLVVAAYCEDTWVGELYAINPDGTIRWQLPGLIGAPRTVVTDSDGNIYVQVSGGSIYAISPDGTQKWSFSCEGDGMGITIGPDGTLYVAHSPGLIALNPNGTEKWRFCREYILYNGGAMRHKKGFPQPAIGQDGTIYIVFPGAVGMVDCVIGSIHALNPDGSVKWEKGIWTYGLSPPSVGADGTIYVAGTYLYAFDPDSGQIIWKRPIKGYEGAYYYTALTPVITLDGNIITGVDHRDYYALRAFDSGSEGEIIWTFRESDNRCDFFLFNPVVDREGIVFIPWVVTHTATQQLTEIYWVDSKNGQTKQVLEIPGVYFAQPRTSNLAIGAKGNLYVLVIVYEGSYRQLKLYCIGGAPPLVNRPPNPPMDLAQLRSDRETEIQAGEGIKESTVVFKAKVSDPDGDRVKLEIALQQIGNPIQRFEESYLVESGSEATVWYSYLSSGDYQWRARCVDEHGEKSEGDNQQGLALLLSF